MIFTDLDAARKPLHSDWHRVGSGLSVRFTLSTSERLDVEWLPRLPTKRELKRVADRYEKARDAFATVVSRHTGRPVVLVEA